MFWVRSNPKISFDWINRPLRSERLGQPEITSVPGLHLMSTRMKPHALFLRLRRADMEISDHRCRSPRRGAVAHFFNDIGRSGHCGCACSFKLSSPRSPGRNGRWRGRRSVLTTAPGATADTMDTRPRHVGFAADPFWYHVLDSARAIVFEWRGATRAGIAILSVCGTVRCRLCRGGPPRVATRR